MKKLIATLFATFVATGILAHNGATGVVKERMDGMGVMKESMKILTPMMQGKTKYDPKIVRREAEKIGVHAGKTLTKLFPEGSDGKPSEAKAEIWKHWDGFSELAVQLRTYSDGLSLAAKNGLMMGGTQNKGMTSSSTMMGSGMAGSGMMGSNGMNDRTLDADELSEMPADGVFMMLSQTCSACHTRFRSE